MAHIQSSSEIDGFGVVEVRCGDARLLGILNDSSSSRGYSLTGLCSRIGFPNFIDAGYRAGAGPYDSNSSGTGKHYALVVGGGFNVPIGNDGPYISWGGNFTGGGGIHLSRGLSVLGEFSFFDNKLPDSFVAAGGGQGGNTKIIALTIDPIFDLFPNSKNSAYLVGGGGYYHKSTNFTVQQCCDFYGYPVNLNVSSFSSNQGGLNFGFGLTHRLGGVYGDGQMKLFGEARYTWINTPKIGEANGLGRTELIPVTFGVRW